MTDRRERPWKKLRVVVEVSVPPHSRAKERDLQYLVVQALEPQLGLPRPMHKDVFWAPPRVKVFQNFWPMFLRIEKGLKNLPTKPTKDQFNGL